jgi:hypothetical protein
MPDTQITELAGRHFLISQLLAGGVEVAMPVRDRGIDLIAYLDRTGEDPAFLACPIQLKANEEARFGLYRKYERIPNLPMVYAWNVSSTSPQLYALTYMQSFKLLEGRGHTETKSLQDDEVYSLTVNEAWRTRLTPHRMYPEDWEPKIRSACKPDPSNPPVTVFAEA